MTFKSAIKNIMAKQGMSQLRLAKLSNMAQTTVSSAIRNGSKAEVYLQLLDVLGYEVIVRPKHRGALADDNYVVGLADEPEVVEEPEISWYAAYAEK